MKNKKDSGCFSEAVKREIYKRAGCLCSFEECLDSVFGPDGNLGNSEYVFGSINVGEAAHIYAAEEDGPRGQGGKDIEFIRSVKNGIWLCRKHHKLVDGDYTTYTFDRLIEMKHVRETAQYICVNKPIVSFYVSRVGASYLDYLVLVADDRDDHDEIARCFIIYAEKVVPFLTALKSANLAPELLVPPPTFSRNRLVIEVDHAFKKNDDFFQKEEKNLLQISRAIDVSRAWCAEEEGRIYALCVPCEIYTRDRVTGEIGAVAKFDANAYSSFKQLDDRKWSINLKVERPRDTVIGIRWEMETFVEGEEYRLRSTIRLLDWIFPDNTMEDYQFEVFAPYAEVLKEIGQGRKPFVRVGINPFSDRVKDREQMYTMEYSVEVLDSQERIQDVISLNDKVLLACELSHEMHMPIIFLKYSSLNGMAQSIVKRNREGFFDSRLTLSLVRLGLMQVKGKLDRGQWNRRNEIVSDCLVEFERDGKFYQIRAVLNGFKFVSFPLCLLGGNLL